MTPRRCKQDGCGNHLPFGSPKQRRYCGFDSCDKLRWNQRQAKKRSLDTLPEPDTGFPRGPGLPPRGGMVFPGPRTVFGDSDGKNVVLERGHIERRDGWFSEGSKTSNLGRAWEEEEVRRLHYEVGLSKEQIAARLDFKPKHVQRLLAERYSEIEAVAVEKRAEATRERLNYSLCSKTEKDQWFEDPERAENETAELSGTYASTIRTLNKATEEAVEERRACEAVQVRGLKQTA
jgi:hypothetical protein